MLHQTRRWYRSYLDEMLIAWLNGCGMLIWEVVFGSWVGWDEQQSTMWREMVSILRNHHELITNGEWEPLTKLADDAEASGLYASKFSYGEDALLTIINKSDRDFHGEIAFGLLGVVPARGVAAISQRSQTKDLIDFSYPRKSTKFPEHQNNRKKVLTGKTQSFDISCLVS